MDKRFLRLLAAILILVPPPTRADRFGFMPSHTITCPTNYVLVPGLSGFEGEDFCIAKYEAKQAGSVAISVATGTPWVSITRSAAITACQANGVGYDLISNAQWQSAARNIENVPTNWSSGTVGSGSMNRGHTDNSPANSLAADPSDANACSGTGQTCSNTVWDTQRRTLVLSNGQVVWDLVGNVMEWVKDDNSTNYGADAKISQISDSTTKDMFGPAGTYTSLNSGEYGGLGFAYRNYTTGAILRGGDWSEGTDGGVFMFLLNWAASTSQTSFGFRCVFKPAKFVVLTSGSSWTVPSDWNNSNNRVECVGGGGGGTNAPSSATAGGGGGGYARKNNLTLTPGASVSYAIGSGGGGNTAGGDSWFVNTSTLLAKGGAGATSTTGGAGGSANVGDTTYSGGNGGGGTMGNGGGGGGGAGNIAASGRAGGTGGSSGGGGGGGNGGSLSSAGSSGLGAGGNGYDGTGGGASNQYSTASAGTNGGGGGGTYSGTSGAGGAGNNFPGGVGPGGGGGAGFSSNGGNGGLYGGGGAGSYGGSPGSGAQGVCVISYRP